MTAAAWSSLTAAMAVSLVFVSPSMRPTARPPLTETARNLVRKNFAHQQEMRLLDSVRHELEQMKEENREVLNLVGSFFDDPTERHGMTETANAVFHDLQRGIKSLIRDLRASSAKTKTALDADIEKIFMSAAKKYEKGIEQKRFPADDWGNGFLREAYDALITLLPHEGKENPDLHHLMLYILGDIGLSLWNEDRDMAGALCLIELIHKAPEDELAEMAWVLLNRQIHFGYTGSSGDHTPVEWRSFLNDLREWMEAPQRN